MRRVKNNKRIIDYCIGILNNNKNKPMNVKKIYATMRMHHWKTNGKTPELSIASKLYMDYRFIKTAESTFKLDPDFYNARNHITKEG